MPDIERLGSALYNPVTGGSENARAATIVKNGTLTAATASNNFWTPAAGKIIRLLGFYITTTANAACGTNDLSVTINDLPTSARAIWSGAFFAPTTGITTNPGQLLIGAITFGPNGLLSIAANNVLQIVISTALTAGTIRITAWGTEE